MPSPAADFLVMTQNVWGSGPLWPWREGRLTRILGSQRPAVVGLVEICAATPSGEESQAHRLAEIAGGYRACFWPGEIEPDGRCIGNAVLCRDDVEVLDRAVERLSLDPDDPLDRVTQRVVSRVTLRFAGEVIDVLVAHLPISKRARARTVTEVIAFAEEGRKASGSAGAVLVGDLNAAHAEAPIRELSERWTDVWRAVHGEAGGGTWPAVSPFIRIDYVMVQPGPRWSLAGCARTPFSGSDHLGVTATIRLSAD